MGEAQKGCRRAKVAPTIVTEKLRYLKSPFPKGSAKRRGFTRTALSNTTAVLEESSEYRNPPPPLCGDPLGKGGLTTLALISNRRVIGKREFPIRGSVKTDPYECFGKVALSETPPPPTNSQANCPPFSGENGNLSTSANLLSLRDISPIRQCRQLKVFRRGGPVCPPARTKRLFTQKDLIGHQSLIERPREHT